MNTVETPPQITEQGIEETLGDRRSAEFQSSSQRNFERSRRVPGGTRTRLRELADERSNTPKGVSRMLAQRGTGDFLAWLSKNNQDDSANEYPWWGSGARPSDVLLIANSDPYAVLLNSKAGIVSAFKHCASWNDALIVVADAFELFMRGLGTTFLERNEQGRNSFLADEVSIEVGGGRGNAFWHWLAE